MVVGTTGAFQALLSLSIKESRKEFTFPSSESRLCVNHNSVLHEPGMLTCRPLDRRLGWQTQHIGFTKPVFLINKLSYSVLGPLWLCILTDPP